MNEYLEKHGIERVENLVGMDVYHIYPSQGIVQCRIRKISFKTNWIIYDGNNNYDIRELGESIFFNYDEAKNYEYSHLNKINMRQQINKASREMDKHNEEIDTLYKLLKKYPTEESRKHFYKGCGTCSNVVEKDERPFMCQKCLCGLVDGRGYINWEPDLEKLKELWVETNISRRILWKKKFRKQLNY